MRSPLSQPSHEVLGHDFVYGELLIGDRGAHTKFLAEYKVMRQAALVANSEVVEFVRASQDQRPRNWVD